MCNYLIEQVKNNVRESNHFDPSSYIIMAKKIIEEHERSHIYRDDNGKSA
ncbi:MAG: hypothetical protein ACFFB2_12780 [Promethearchaeota archaeon]